MLFLLKLILRALRVLARSRRALVLENLALRQQLATLSHRGRRPQLVTVDCIDAQLRELIARMVRENRWGAPRIHGELVKLGFRICERTVSRYVRILRPRRPSGTSWKTFLDNHREVLVAMDFFIVPTVTFRLLYALLVIQHDRRKILHVNVTAHPTAVWVMQQLREAFPFETRSRFILLDRDSIFSTEVWQALQSMTIRPIRTAYHSPWQNGVAERWIGTCRHGDG